MPDAAKLVAALCVGLIGFFVSFQIMPLMPESTAFGYFAYVNLILGILAGWIVMGKRAGRGITAAINNGFGGMLTLVIWGLFVQACYEMFDNAVDNWYRGPFDALLAIFQIMAEYGLVLINPVIIGSLIVGGVLSGLATEYAWRTWK
jgi:hypothetical protein